MVKKKGAYDILYYKICLISYKGNMFCRNCGSKNEDDSLFCTKCGRKLVGEAVENNETNPSTSSTIKNEKMDSFITGITQNTIQMCKKITKIFLGKSGKIFYGIGAGIIGIIFTIIIFSNFDSTINLDKYIEVSYSGYESYGNAVVSIDWAGIENKYGNKIKYTNAGMSAYGKEVEPIYALAELVSNPNLDKHDKLSNNDKIKYTWDINENNIKKYIKCKLKYSDKVLTVSNLTKIETFDAFENLDVKFYGVAPEGTLEYDYSGDIFNKNDFSADKVTDLSAGDVITITLNVKDMSYIVNKYGKIPAETEKKYTVDKLDKYITTTSEISEELLEKLKTDIESNINNTSNGNVLIDNITYIGDYVIAAKNNNWNPHNKVGIIYKLDLRVSNDLNIVSSLTRYYSAMYLNAINKVDGTAEWWDNLERGNSYDHYIGYGGYQSLEDIKKEHTSRYGNMYTFDWNVEGISNDNATTKATTEDYLCPYSSEREITNEEIASYLKFQYYLPGNRSILQMIVNEMYAKYGYKFKDDELNQYFNEKEWYRNIENKSDDMDTIYKNMSVIEQKNITNLNMYR